MFFKKLFQNRNNDKEQKIIRYLKKTGYVLRIPGGSSRAGDHSAFGCIYRANTKLEVEILLVPYNPNITIERKYEEDKFQEVPEGTLALKISEQTGVKIYDPINIGTQIAWDRRYPVKTRRHYKYVFVTDKYDDSGAKVTPTTDGRIGIPIWVTLPKARKHICPQHRWILEKLEKYLVMESNSYFAD